MPGIENISFDSADAIDITENGYSVVTLAALATTTVKTGAGVLHAISIHHLGTSGTIVVYDNTTASGNVIFGNSATVNVTVPSTHVIDARFNTGLTVVLGGTAAMRVYLYYR